MISASKAKAIHASTTLVEVYELNQRYCDLCAIRSYDEVRSDLLAVEAEFRQIKEQVQHVLRWFAKGKLDDTRFLALIFAFPFVAPELFRKFFSKELESTILRLLAWTKGTPDSEFVALLTRHLSHTRKVEASRYGLLAQRLRESSEAMTLDELSVLAPYRELRASAISPPMERIHQSVQGLPEWAGWLRLLPIHEKHYWREITNAGGIESLPLRPSKRELSILPRWLCVGFAALCAKWTIERVEDLSLLGANLELVLRTAKLVMDAASVADVEVEVLSDLRSRCQSLLADLETQLGGQEESFDILEDPRTRVVASTIVAADVCLATNAADASSSASSAAYILGLTTAPSLIRMRYEHFRFLTFEKSLNDDSPVPEIAFAEEIVQEDKERR